VTTLSIRRFIVLFIAALIGVYAVLPHLGRHLGEFATYAVVAGIAAAAGTYLTRDTALESPMLDAVLMGRPLPRRALTLMATAVGFGAVTAVLLIAADSILIRTGVGASLPHPSVWTGFLYALYGGVSEEVVFHYGLLAAVAWIAFRLMPPAASYWLAIAISAVALGLSHILISAAVLPLTPLVVARTLTLTALGGVVTGWLYWRRGLEAAMVAHGIIGFALHVWAPGVFIAA
jgi:Type II CAAX prenyl endopeptidase Rce1-like